MDRDSGSSGGMPGGGLIVVVLLAVGALVISKAPLETSRPATSGPHFERLEAAQDIDARLWEDPFRAVARARERIQKSPGGEKDQNRHSEERFADELARQQRLAGDGGVFVVAVMLFGGPYAEQVESRRRLRYAVLAGLQSRGFVPSDNEHLGYFYPYDGSGLRNGLPETVPFETFERPANAGFDVCKDCRLVVLWLDGSSFYGRPLKKLLDLATRTAPRGESPAEPRPKVRWRVLGPASSDGLRAVIEEATEAGFDSGKLMAFDFRFFANGATAPDDILLSNNDPPTTVSGFLETRGIPLVRTIGTDDLLAKAIRAELELRGLKAEVKCPRSVTDTAHTPDRPSAIAVIGEGDTLYGRALRAQFRSNIEENEKGFCVTRYTYFRGIDGRLPGDAAPQASDGRNKKESGSEGADAIGREGAYIERPEGTSQFDYLRRLANQIRADDEKLRRDPQTEQGIRAVGVLGNDVYDKLLVLQALQPELPNAIFFTTDLDARLFHPREQAWTRNLIVASSFGLSLSESLQRGTAPFRDSYQTATYLATLMLVADVSKAARDPTAGPQWKQSDISKWFENPRLFEVTRSNFFDFSPKGPKVNCRPWRLEKCVDIHPEPSPLWPELPFTARFLIFGVLTSALSVPVLALNRNLRRRLRRFVADAGPSEGSRSLRRVLLLLLFLALALALSLLLASMWPSIAEWMTEAGKGKPLSITEGISPWPSYAIRLAALLLSVYFVVQASVSLRSNIDRIAYAFHLGPTRRRLNAVLGARERQLTWWSRLLSMFEVRFYRGVARASGTGTAMTPNAENFWMHYIVQSRSSARVLRTLACVVVMVLVFALFWNALGEASIPPRRGDLSFSMHILSTLPTVLAIQFLIYFVADATVLSVHFVRGLRMHATNWPEATLAAFHARLGVPIQYLNDWIDLEFIARRTRCVSALIYYPFIVLSLMILARSSFFDDWYAPVALHVVTAVSFGVVLACAFALRRSAEASRRQTVTRLRDAIVHAKGEPGGGALASRLEALRDRAERLREGAFAPYSQQPLLRALLLPLLTFGGSSLFDYLSLANL